MHKTDSKIRLLFELTYQKDVQITSFIPLRDYSNSWKPEKMYIHPHNQYYYIFINDPELIEKIKEAEKEGQEYLFKFAKYLEKSPDFQGNDFLIEFNANSIENCKINPNEEQYVVCARINIDNFSFINDYKTASKAYLLEKNKPLIYANEGKIKEFLIGEKFEINRNMEENNLNNSNQSNKEDKKDEDNDEKSNAKKKKNDEPAVKHIPGNWFLINMNNLNYVKKDVYDNLGKQKLIKFLSLIKYKEVTPVDQDQNTAQEYNQSQHQNNQIRNNLSNEDDSSSEEIKEMINEFKLDNKYQQPQEFAFRPSENSKLVTVYQPKSCKEHSKKNDFWCKTCNTFCCLDCLVGSSNANFNMNTTNTHQNHKIHLLDEIINKTEEDSNALEERIKNLIKIIETEIRKKQEEIGNLKEENEKTVKVIQKLFEDNNNLIRQEELKRTKELAALVNEILRINDENNKRINYLNKLFDNRSMNEYLMNYFIYKNNFVEETKKNLGVLERKVAELINYYKKK